MISTDDLLDTQQVADLLGLSHRNSVTTYVKRYRDFPRPIVVRAGGRVQLWARGDVLAWQSRGDPTRAAALDHVNSSQLQRILQAAGRLLLSDPFGQLSVRQIADEAGVPHPVLYRHVRTKQELLEAVVEDAIRRMGAAMNEAEHATWRAYVPEVVNVMLDNADSVRLFALWLIEGGGSERFSEIAIMPRMLAALQADPRYDGSGAIPADAAVAGAAALLVGAIVFEPRIRHLIGVEALPADTLARLVTAVFEMALSGP